MPTWGEVAPIVVGLVLLGVLAGVRGVRWLERRRGRVANRRGARGETDGVRILEREGFEVLERQVRAHSTVELDGETTTFDLWLDAVVEKNGRRYVAEFKTGAVASVHHAATRRQLLEYALARPGYGLVLVDATDGELVQVEFPRLRALVD